MSDTAQTLVGISFPDRFRAQEFLQAVTRLASLHHLKLADAVLIAKDDEGNAHVHETLDPTPGRAALSGAMWAGLFGLVLGGPVGWVAGLAVGAGAGAVTAKVVDLGVPDAWVDWFRLAAQPGKAILTVLVADLDQAALVDELKRFTGAELVYANVSENWQHHMREALGQADPSVAAPGAALPPPPPPSSSTN
jgi:uncharacterized membrane protein